MSNDPAATETSRGATLNLNWALPTLGGRQLWGDVMHFRGWRIQQNVWTSHYRLLDPGDIRRAWGSLEQCQRRLAEIRVEQNLPPLSGKAVILVHGILRSSKTFAPLQSRLEEHGYIGVPFDYPSTRVPIPRCADYLRQVVESLHGIDRIDFVVHSMGGLIVRSYLQQTADRPDPRIHRMVMLGVPNLGARLASIAEKNILFRALFGPAGQQLVEHPEGIIAGLPTPGFEFGIVAGCRGVPQGFNPLIAGDDDGVVGVAATRLPGATDFIALPGWHSFLPSNPECVAAAERFLETGAFRESGERQPIPRTAAGK
jgi:pimeloyl-ACP methyl ester carboxylesterase